MARQRDIARRTDSGITSAVSAFRNNLEDLIARASARTLAVLRRELDIDERDRIVVSAANQTVLRRIDRLFIQQLDASGFQALIKGFVTSFPGQLPVFNETLDYINANLKTKLPDVKFHTALGKTLAVQQVNAASILRRVVQAAAETAAQKAVFSVGGYSFEDLSEILASQFRRSIGQAETLAATAMAMYYRTLAANGYGQIEKVKEEVRYVYLGPLDRLTRPFCRAMLKRSAKQPLTHVQIEKLDNGQLPNPFITGGGYNCRHQWAVAEVGQESVPAEGKALPAVKELAARAGRAILSAAAKTVLRS